MGGGTQTTTSSTAPSNPAVNSAITSLAGGIEQAYGQGPKTFNESLYGGVGPTTRKGWDMSLASAYDPTYSGGVKGAMSYAGGLADGSGPSLTESTLMPTARGDFLDGKDPYFQRDLARTLDDTGADVNSFFGASGRLGSTGHVGDLTTSLGGVRDRAYLGERENSRNRQMQALSSIEGMRQQGVNNAFTAQAALPSLYSAAQLPAATVGAVGGAQDADTQATLLGRNDLFRRQSDAQTDLLAKLSSILSGNAAAAGTTTTETRPTTPWWQSALGLGLAFL